MRHAYLIAVLDATVLDAAADAGMTRVHVHDDTATAVVHTPTATLPGPAELGPGAVLVFDDIEVQELVRVHRERPGGHTPGL